MTKTKKRTLIALFIIFGIPLLGLLVGWLASLKEDKYSDNRAIDLAGGLILGIFATVFSLILWAIISHSSKKN